MDEGRYKSMYPTGCMLPQFYGLPKVHKTGTALGLFYPAGVQLLMG